jgi:PKD repeat protein
MLYSTVGNTGELGDFHLYAIAVPTGTTTLITTLEEAQAVPGDVTLSPDERYAYIVDTPGNWIGAGVRRVDVDPASPTYGEVISLVSWIGELQHGEYTSDGRSLVMSNAQMNQLMSLCLADDCIPLEADFSASPLCGTAPLAVDFRNLSRRNYATLGWDFGDGGTSAESDPIHVFQSPGTFAIALTITGTGGTDTETKAACIAVRAEVYLPLVLKSKAGT